MKPRHLLTAALGALVLSCQGPAAVLAREAPEARRAAAGAGLIWRPAERAPQPALRRTG